MICVLNLSADSYVFSCFRRLKSKRLTNSSWLIKLITIFSSSLLFTPSLSSSLHPSLPPPPPAPCLINLRTKMADKFGNPPPSYGSPPGMYPNMAQPQPGPQPYPNQPYAPQSTCLFRPLILLTVIPPQLIVHQVVQKFWKQKFWIESSELELLNRNFERCLPRNSPQPLPTNRYRCNHRF